VQRLGAKVFEEVKKTITNPLELNSNNLIFNDHLSWVTFTVLISDISSTLHRMISARKIINENGVLLGETVGPFLYYL